MVRQTHGPAAEFLAHGLGAGHCSAGVNTSASFPTTAFFPRVLVPLICLLAMEAILGPTIAAEALAPPFHIGFSTSMFMDVNENDARAAIKIWGEEIARDQNVPTDPAPVILKNIDGLFQALREKRVDALGITLLEYDQLRHEVALSPIFVTYISGSMTERYVLLAHRKGPVKTLGDLNGRNLALHVNPRTCLALLWLDTLLIQGGHPAVTQFTGDIFRKTKLAKTVLPVYFRKIDTCVVTRNGFNTMTELNPQLARDLVIIAESSEIVPTIFALRADYNPIYKEKIIVGVRGLEDSPAGKQVLTIFQSDSIDVKPASCLDATLALIKTHKQIVHKGQKP